MNGLFVAVEESAKKIENIRNEAQSCGRGKKEDDLHGLP